MEKDRFALKTSFLPLETFSSSALTAAVICLTRGGTTNSTIVSDFSDSSNPLIVFVDETPSWLTVVI